MEATIRFAVMCLLIAESLCVYPRRRPGSGEACPGCPIEAGTNDQGVVEAANFVIQWLNTQQWGHTLVRIHRAQTQVVAGTNYILELIIRKFGRVRRCSATIWHKLDGTMEVTNTNC